MHCWRLSLCGLQDGVPWDSTASPIHAEHPRTGCTGLGSDQARASNSLPLLPHHLRALPAQCINENRKKGGYLELDRTEFEWLGVPWCVCC
jgi:hypothetical protein